MGRSIPRGKYSAELARIPFDVPTDAETWPTTRSWSRPISPSLRAEYAAGRQGAIGRGPNVIDITGQNKLGHRRSGPVDGVVIHHTADNKSIPELVVSANKEFGAQYYVDRDGTIYQLAPDDWVLQHVSGEKHWRPQAGRFFQNENTIGIEVVAKNDSDVTPAQRKATVALIERLQEQHGFPSDNVFGHRELQHNKNEKEGFTIAQDYRLRNPGRSQQLHAMAQSIDAARAPEAAFSPTLGMGSTLAGGRSDDASHFSTAPVGPTSQFRSFNPELAAMARSTGSRGDAVDTLDTIASRQMPGLLSPAFAAAYAAGREAAFPTSTPRSVVPIPTPRPQRSDLELPAVPFAPASMLGYAEPDRTPSPVGLLNQPGALAAGPENTAVGLLAGLTAGGNIGLLNRSSGGNIAPLSRVANPQLAAMATAAPARPSLAPAALFAALTPTNPQLAAMGQRPGNILPNGMTALDHPVGTYINGKEQSRAPNAVGEPGSNTILSSVRNWNYQPAPTATVVAPTVQPATYQHAPGPNPNLSLQTQIQSYLNAAKTAQSVDRRAEMLAKAAALQAQINAIARQAVAARSIAGTRPRGSVAALPSWSPKGLANVTYTPASFNPVSGGPNYGYTIGTNSAGRSITSYSNGRGATYSFPTSGVATPSQALTAINNGGGWSNGTGMYGGFSSSSGGFGGTVLCTHYMRKGWLPKRIWAADMRYSLTLPRTYYAGYRLWADPILAAIERGGIGGRLLQRAMWPIVNGWAREAAHRAGQGPGSRLGRAVHFVLGTLSRTLGNLALAGGRRIAV